MLFLQPPSGCFLSSPLRITNTTVDHNYFVQQSPWEAYSLSADQNITCLSMFTKTVTRLCHKPENAVDILVSHSLKIHFNIIHTTTHISHKFSCHSRFPSKYDIFVIYIGLKYIIHTLSPSLFFI